MALTGSSQPEPATIRRAEERDYVAVRDLYAQLHSTHANNQPQVFAPASECELRRDEFFTAIEAQDTIVVVAECGGDIVAAAQASLVNHVGNTGLRAGRSVYVTHLVTSPRARRQGHGRALMAAITAWANLHDAPRIQLYVWDGNTEAAAFYRALGYDTMALLLARQLPETARPAQGRAGPECHSDDY